MSSFFCFAVGPPGGEIPLRVGVGALWREVLSSIGWCVGIAKVLQSPRAESKCELVGVASLGRSPPRGEGVRTREFG